MPLIDVDTAAERLNVTHKFVRRLVTERRVPYLNVGKFVRFDPVELENWLEDCRVDQRATMSELAVASQRYQMVRPGGRSFGEAARGQ